MNLERITLTDSQFKPGKLIRLKSSLIVCSPPSWSLSIIPKNEIVLIIQFFGMPKNPKMIEILFLWGIRTCFSGLNRSELQRFMTILE